MKNILLLFLSDVKVFKGNVSVANYKYIGDTKTTNESAVRYLSKIKGAPPNKIFYFSSTKVKSLIKKDRNSTENFTEDGKTFTHVEYFENRIKDFIGGNIKEVMQPCNFDEDADIQQTMKVVVEMASMIQSYIGNDTNVTLNVDMTGGMRHASLMMLVITRLIQYSGVKIGHILYSNFVPGRAENFVEESNDIYKMFDLIAGAEEFVRFGSVEAIQGYFANREIPKVLQDLLDAMNKFAEAIKISRRREFQKALEGLKNAYEKFSAESRNFSAGKDIPSLNYNLMQQLEVRIAKEYSTLLKCPADDYVSIIEWCLAHGYIQQALVLYTESFPYMMIAKHHIVGLNPIYDKELADYTDKDGMKREKDFLLINDFDPKKYPDGSNYNSKPIFDAYDDFIRRLQSAIQSIRLNKFKMETFNKDNISEYWVGMFNIIQSDYDNYVELLEELQTLKSNPDLTADIKTVAEKFSTLYSFWDLIPKNIFKIPVNQRADKIFETLCNAEPSAFRIKTNNTLIIHHMIMHDILRLNVIDEKTFLKIIDRYFIIKSERNDSVHATRRPKELIGDANSEISYATLLKGYMNDGLNEYSEAIKI